MANILPFKQGTPRGGLAFVVAAGVFVLCGLALPSAAEAAVITWDGGGGADTNWNTAANWSGDTIPGTADIATFDGTSTNNATINVNVDVAGIDINAGYTGTITQATGVTVTVGSNNFDISAGTFTGGNSAIDVNGAFTVSGGTFTSTSGTLSVSGNFTVSSGSFGESTGTVTFDGGAATIDVATSETFNHLTLAADGTTKTVADNDTLTVTGTLTLTDGRFNQTTIPAGGTIAAQGNITQASTADSGSARVEITGTANQTFTGNATGSAGALPNIEIDKSGGTLTLTGTIRMTGFRAWTYTAGTIDATTNDSTVVFGGSNVISGSHTLDNVTFDGAAAVYDIADNNTLTVAGTLTLTRGQLDQTTAPATGTIAAQGNIIQASTFDGSIGPSTRIEITGSANQTFTGNATTTAGGLPVMEIDKSGGTLTLTGTIRTDRAWTYTAGTLAAGTSTVVFDGTTMTITGSHALNNVEFRSTATKTIASGTTLTAAGTLTLTDGIINTGTLEAQGNVTVAAGADGGTAALTFSGGNAQTYTDNGGTKTTGTVTVNKTAGSAVTLATNMTYTGTGQDLTVTAGTLDLAGFTLTVNDVFTLGASGTLQLQGGETVSTIDTISAGSTVVYNGTTAFTGLVAGTSYSNLTFNGSGGTWTLNAALDVNGTLTITAGILDVSTSNYAITVGGNWSNSGTFTARSGTVTLDGADQTLSGTTTFYNLTKTITGIARTLTFSSGSANTQTIKNTLTLKGASDARLFLRSTSAGTQWRIGPEGTRSVEYLDVQDSHNVNDTAISCLTGCVDSRNNTNWLFASPTATIPASVSQATDGSGDVTFQTTVADSDSDLAQLKVEYSLDQSTWKKATIGSVTASHGGTLLDNAATYQIQSVDTGTGPVTLTIVWRSKTELPAHAGTAYIRVTPFDGTVEGTTAVSAALALDNAAPSISAFALKARTATALTLGWKVNAAGETNFSAYVLCYGTDSNDVRACRRTAGIWDAGDDAALRTLTTEQTTITGLIPNISYAILLKASDAFGNESSLFGDGFVTAGSPLPSPSPTPSPTPSGAFPVPPPGDGGLPEAFPFPPEGAGIVQTVTGTVARALSGLGRALVKLPQDPREAVAQLLNVLAPATHALADRGAHVVLGGTGALSVAASSSLLTALPGIVGQLPQYFWSLGQALVGLLGFRSKRRPWGRVVDAGNGAPVPGAYVQVFDHGTQKLRDTSFANARGGVAFSSLLPPGTYDVRVQKPGWTLALATETLFLRLVGGERVYDGRPITVTREGLLSLVFALRTTAEVPTVQRILGRITFQHIELFLARLSWPFLLVGAFLGTVALSNAATAVNVSVEVLYAVLVTAKVAIQFRYLRAVGTVTDARTGRPLGLALIRLYSESSKKLVATRATSALGQFFFLPPPGVYTLSVVREGYVPYQRSRVVVQPEAREALVFNLALNPLPLRTMAVGMT